jgi:rRNA maturation protein Nop10
MDVDEKKEKWKKVESAAQDTIQEIDTEHESDFDIIHVNVCPDCGTSSSGHLLDPPPICPHEYERYIPIKYVPEDEYLKLRKALQEIHDKQGKVCSEFEICEHISCQSSCSSWFIADQALNPDYYQD